MTVARWLYHVRVRGPLADPYVPPSLASEGFVHCSFQPAVLESARLYFPPGAVLEVLQIDPRRLTARIEVAATPRGPMPHVHGPIPADAIVARRTLAEIAQAPDAR